MRLQLSFFALLFFSSLSVHAGLFEFDYLVTPMKYEQLSEEKRLEMLTFNASIRSILTSGLEVKEELFGLLYHAVVQNDYEKVFSLLVAGADPNLDLLPHGNRLIHLAAAHKRQTLLLLLNTGNADPNVINAKRETPLFLAIRGSDHESFLYLLAKGASVHTGCPHGMTYLQLVAMDSKNLAFAKDLIEIGKMDVNDDPGRTLGGPLHIAAMLGQVEMIQFLISKKADDRARPDGMTPIALWEQFQQEALVQGTLEAGYTIVNRSPALSAFSLGTFSPSSLASELPLPSVMSLNSL